MSIDVAANGSDMVVPGNPAHAGRPWSRIAVAALALTALISSIPCLLAAPGRLCSLRSG